MILWCYTIRKQEASEPTDGLKDLSCTLINAVREFSSEILCSHIQRMANYLDHQASVEPDLYPYVLWSTWLTLGIFI